MSQQLQLPRIGISHGDINGIGYEIIIKALQDARLFEICTPVVYGSPKVAAYYRKTINAENFSLSLARNAGEATGRRGYIIDCIDENARVEMGKVTASAGLASFQALERAVSDLTSGAIDALVTAPIHKGNIQNDDFHFPGHTEYITHQFPGEKSLMVMVSDYMRVGIVTGHVPISQVSSLITIDLVLEKLRLLHAALLRDFRIRGARIAVFGLNPHAGDDGFIGKEEQEVIIPAIQKANAEGIVALGPYSADGFFTGSHLRKFDAILAMYHDQGLAPFKALSYGEGVNVTCGLPVIRTSPAHGTAFDIVGKNEASHSSLLKAIFHAVDIWHARAEYAEISANPLHFFEVARPEN